MYKDEDSSTSIYSIGHLLNSDNCCMNTYYIFKLHADISNEKISSLARITDIVMGVQHSIPNMTSFELSANWPLDYILIYIDL